MSAPATSGAAAGTPAACAESGVRVAMSAMYGAMGHESVLLLLTNSGGSTCMLQGYPTASLVNPDGSVALTAQATLTGMMGGAEGMSAPPSVAVLPGQSVSAVLEWDDNQAVGRPACLSTANLELRVSPPGAHLAATLAFPNADITDICPETFLVHPVLAGVYSRPSGT